MKQAVLGTIAGYLAWTALWLGVGLGVLAPLFSGADQEFQDGGVLSDLGYLASSLVLSVVCSLVGGWTCDKITRQDGRRAVVTLALFLLATGIAVQASVWSRMPIWYHAAFLILLVPATLLGGSWAHSKGN